MAKGNGGSRVSNASSPNGVSAPREYSPAEIASAREDIRSTIRDLGYKMNRSWSMSIDGHRLDNFKVGNNPPLIWIDNERMQRITDGALLEDVLLKLRALKNR